MHNMGVLIRRPKAEPKVSRPTKCPQCGCGWGYLDTDDNAIKCGCCDRILEYK